MPRKSIENGCTPCTLDAKVLPKGIIIANGFAFTGSRGTGSRCQLNRGINTPRVILRLLKPDCHISYAILPVIMPHMKQASSLATAAAATFLFFLLAISRYIFLILALALSAYAITSGEHLLCRFISSLDFCFLVLPIAWAASISSKRRCEFPALVMGSLFTLVLLESSPGTVPR